jgi:hypothetical protein
MKDLSWKSALGVTLLLAGMARTTSLAQAPQVPAPSANQPAPKANPNPVDLNWTPPALTRLSAQAATKSSFTLDRDELIIAAALAGGSDDETKQAIKKIDGVSVHLLLFGSSGIADEASVNAIRDGYHLRGWKHLVTTEAAAKSPLHNGKTDLWLVLDGANVRGAVVLVETSKSVTLATMAGNLSPADLLHLRGHFGIPRFEGSDFKTAKDN